MRLLLILTLLLAGCWPTTEEPEYDLPERMWMYEDRGPLNSGGDSRVVIPFFDGTNNVLGIFGVVRYEGEYVVVWEPLPVTVK